MEINPGSDAGWGGFPVSLYLALRDAALTPGQFRVYAALHLHLTWYEFRPIKTLWVAREVHMLKPSVFRILRALVARSYLVPGPVAGVPPYALHTYAIGLPPHIGR